MMVKVNARFLPHALLLLSFAACSRLPIGVQPPTAPPLPETITAAPAATTVPPPPIELAEITFRVTIPADTPSDGPIQLTLLDEVTGLALNTTHHAMQAESENIYAVVVQLPANAVIKYRYTRGGDILAAEHTSNGRPVRYRLLHTTASGSVHDIVTRWNDTAYTGPTGRVEGTITDLQTGLPIRDLLITAGGQQTLTRWDGTYLIEGLPPGTHNLVSYALDGRYSIFQQGAVVATQASTPASFSLRQASLTTVTFFVDVPDDTIPAVPLRIAGNLTQLGNTFSDLAGGINTPAARLPQMQYDPDGYYILTMSLPAGAYIQYKYTLGDGFWNLETDTGGDIRLREFIVPQEDTVLNDRVENWASGPDRAPVWFAVTTPENTPPRDTVWLQLNPWGWTEPLPMWQTGPNSWVYLLSSPLNMIGDVEFRYCRNADCEKGREVATEAARRFSPSGVFQPFEDSIARWNLWDTSSLPALVPSSDILPRQAGFVTGFGLPSRFHPSWISHAPQSFAGMRAGSANTLVLSPTWAYTRIAPPVFEPVAGADMSGPDIHALAAAGHTAGLNIALFPNPRFPDSAEAWWLEAPRDFGWWVNWFEKYGTFVQHHAGLANDLQAGTLILGGSWLNPALPDGFMADGFTSGVPADAEAWWREILSNARSAYPGRIAWALTFSEGVPRPPAFLDEIDEIYLQWDLPLASAADASQESMAEAAGLALDSQLLPFFLRYNKPIILVLYFQSAAGSAMGCVPAEGGGCQPPGAVDLEEQAQAYAAVLAAVNARDWISGVVSGEYYLPVAVLDRTSSVNGKPAEALLSAWFRGWLGEP